jgi:hypothetical protein
MSSARLVWVWPAVLGNAHLSPGTLRMRSQLREKPGHRLSVQERLRLGFLRCFCRYGVTPYMVHALKP